LETTADWRAFSGGLNLGTPDGMRPLRIQGAGLIYHVMGRGNNKMPIYLDDLDRLKFITILNEMLEKYEVDCWTSCEMGNHYHLVLRTRLPNLSRAMRTLNGEYARWWNCRHGRVGHVFQGRFKGQIIEDGAYLLRACRYVMMNPVRGHLCRSPEEWPWSSYRALVGLPAKPWHIDFESLLRRFGEGDLAELQESLIAYVDGEDPEMAMWIRSDRRIVGSDEFAARFREAASAASDEVPLRERRIGTPSLIEILTSALEQGDGLNGGMVSAHRDYAYSVEDIARCAGISPRTIARLLKRALPGSEVTVAEWG
jgi:putative transposase